MRGLSVPRRPARCRMQSCSRRSGRFTPRRGARTARAEELRETHKLHVSRKRVARLMREAGIQGVHRRKRMRTTIRDDDARPAPDLVDRNFEVDRPDRLWVADITYVPTWSGFLFLAVVLDAFSRRIVGWAMATHLRSSLVLSALDMELFQRKPSDVTHPRTRARSTRH